MSLRLAFARTSCTPMTHCVPMGWNSWNFWVFRVDIFFGSTRWQAAPIKISTVFLVFSMVSAFLARFLELAASYCWLLLCNQKRYCGFYGIWCGLHDSVSDLHFDGFPVLRGSGHKSARSAQRGWLGKRRSTNRASLHKIFADFSCSVFSAVSLSSWESIPSHLLRYFNCASVFADSENFRHRIGIQQFRQSARGIAHILHHAAHIDQPAWNAHCPLLFLPLLNEFPLAGIMYMPVQHCRSVVLVFIK